MILAVFAVVCAVASPLVIVQGEKVGLFNLKLETATNSQAAPCKYPTYQSLTLHNIYCDFSSGKVFKRQFLQKSDINFAHFLNRDSFLVKVKASCSFFPRNSSVFPRKSKFSFHLSSH